MKIIRMVLRCLVVAGLAQAETVVLDSTSESIIANGSTQGKSIAVTGGAKAFNVGDAAKITCDLGIVGVPTYEASANWSVGFIDGNSHGAALSIRLNGNALWSASVDSSAGGSGSNTADLGAEYRESATGVQGSAFDLKNDGESATFELNVTKTTATEYAFVAHWKDSDGNILQTFSKSDDNGVEIESINTISFGNRVTTGAVTGLLTNLVLDVTPAGEPSPLDSSLIAPNHTHIVFSGSKYISASSNKVSFLRHSDDTLVDPDRAFTSSKATKSTGISVSFKTDSDSILVKFSQDLAEGARFSHYENDGAPVAGSYSTSTNLSFTINSANPGTASVFRVTLPPWAQADFLGLELDEGASIFPYTPPEQKTYVTIGDSITHGRGQRMTSETYPWLVAEALNLNLYNVAVGGSKVSVPIAEMLSEFPPVDVISVLIGYNDLHGAGKTAAEYASDLGTMLDALRVSQPEAQVVCISPTYTTDETNETTGVTIHEFRQVVVDDVAARRAAGDLNIHLIRGEALTAAADLDDTVHLSIDGAASFAAGLAPLIESILEDEAQVSYPLYGEAVQLYSNSVPYNLTNEVYTFSEVYRIPAAEHFKTLNNGTSPNRSPIATRGDSTFLLVVDEGRRPQVLKIEGGSAEKGYLDKSVYLPDEFYTPPTSADYYRMLDDGHHTGALGVDEEGYIHVVCDMHNYPRYANPMAHLPLRFHSKNILYWRSDNPYDVSSFTFMGDQATGCPQGIGFTYPYFFNDLHGKLYFTSRAHQEDTTRCAAYSAYSAAEGTWSVIGGTVPDESDHPRLFWEDNGEGGGTYNKTYPFGVFDRANNLHVSTPLLNTDRSPEGEIIHFATDILYLTSSNGGQSFTKADGTPVSVPARAEAGPGQADVIYTNEYLSILGNVAVDYENNPYTVAKVKYADGSDSDTYVLGWDGSSWVNYGDIANRASADFRLVHDPAGVMTLIPDSYYKIQRFWKPDGTIRTIELPWNLTNIDYEYLKQTGHFMGLTWDGDDWLIVKVEINNRPGMERIDSPEPSVFNHAPEITGGATFDGTNLTVSASDADGDSLTYTWWQTYGSEPIIFSENGTASASTTTPAFPGVGTYEVKVAVSDGVHTRISTGSISTEPEAKVEQVLAYEDFESGFSIWNNAGNCSIKTDHAIDTQSALARGEGGVMELASPLDLSGFSLLQVDFSMVTSKFDDPADMIWLQYSPDGSSWTTVGTAVYGTDFNNDVRSEISLLVSNADGSFSSTAEFRLMNNTDSLTDYAYLDNIRMTGIYNRPAFLADPMRGTDAETGMAYSGTLAGSAFDADGDSLLYSVSDGPVWLNVAANGALSGIPGVSNAGGNVFTVLVSDGHGNTGYATFNIDVIVSDVDSDGDGLTDAQEAALGTSPNDPGSRFGITDRTHLPMSGKIRICWPSATGVLYKVWKSADMENWSVARDWASAATPPEDSLDLDLSPSNGYFKVEADIQ